MNTPLQVLVDKESGIIRLYVSDECRATLLVSNNSEKPVVDIYLTPIFMHLLRSETDIFNAIVESLSFFIDVPEDEEEPFVIDKMFIILAHTNLN